MADKPPGKSAVSSRDPRLVYRPIETGTTTPPTAGGTPLVPAGVLSPERGERGPRQVGGKSRRSSSEEEEQKPRKRLDTASTPSPSDPEEGGGEEMASTSATSGSDRSDSESSSTSTDTTPSRSTSYVELESLANAGKAAATKPGSKDTSTAAGSNGATAGRISPNVMSFAEAAASPRVSPTPRPRTSPRPSTSRTQTGPTATSTPEQAGAAPPTSVGPTKPKGDLLTTSHKARPVPFADTAKFPGTIFLPAKSGSLTTTDINSIKILITKAHSGPLIGQTTWSRMKSPDKMR
ncbi:hypothetical protein K1T71_014557 [Dendrolimus kikuchii]|uniref:Uncharacterized protein n=1 Tax=Dendrolimus kikuchii TaxID=765133 RepID=A0ACC1CEE6_9NEOP|nr:hypothetical protein K1T71_014557 [Dendrolimus kikuchii]